MESFWRWPLNGVLLHLAVLGLIFCFARWPIFGRPRVPAEASASDFAKHVEAMGELLRRTKDRAYAEAKLAEATSLPANPYNRTFHTPRLAQPTCIALTPKGTRPHMSELPSEIPPPPPPPPTPVAPLAPPNVAPPLPSESASRARSLFDRITAEIAKIYVGQDELVLGTLVALFASGLV